MPPSIVPNIIYIAPTYIALEIINVGNAAAKEISIIYQLKGISSKERIFSPPLLKIGESKTIFFQDDKDTLIADINVYKKKQTFVEMNVKFKDASKLVGKYINQKNSIDVSKYVKENEQNSVRFDDTTLKKIESNLRKLTQDFGNYQRDFKRLENTVNGRLLLERVKFEIKLIEDSLQGKIKQTIYNHVLQLIRELSILLIDPYLDLRKKEISVILDKIEKLNRLAYDDVWKYFTSLKFSRVEYRVKK